MRKVLLTLGALSLIFAALVYPVALGVAGSATEAYMIAGKDPGTFQMNEELFDPPKGASKDGKEYRDEVLRIYGVPTDETTKVVFWPAEKFIHPKQLPGITILPVYKEKGENPLQVKTVFFFATRMALGAAIAGLVLAGIGAAMRKKQASAPPPPTPAR
jgi:hypothetical protein